MVSDCCCERRRGEIMLHKANISQLMIFDPHFRSFRIIPPHSKITKTQPDLYEKSNLFHANKQPTGNLDNPNILILLLFPTERVDGVYVDDPILLDHVLWCASRIDGSSLNFPARSFHCPGAEVVMLEAHPYVLEILTSVLCLRAYSHDLIHLC
jgi:hypothetical protein